MLAAVFIVALAFAAVSEGLIRRVLAGLAADGTFVTVDLSVLLHFVFEIGLTLKLRR